jgi:hypothetical protein
MRQRVGGLGLPVAMTGLPELAEVPPPEIGGQFGVSLWRTQLSRQRISASELGW